LKYRINAAKTTAPNPDAYQQMLFSSHDRNIVYFVLDRRVLVFDLTIHQAVGSIVLDRTRPSFRQLILTPDLETVLFCIHEDGSLSSWKRQSHHSFSYEMINSVDVLRVARQSRKRGVRDLAVMGAVAPLLCQPYSTPVLTIISSDGTLWTVEWQDVRLSPTGTPLAAPSLCIKGELEAVSSSITSLCVQAQDIDSKTSDSSSALVALGTQDGKVQLVDLRVKELIRSIVIHSGAPVRGIRWVDHHRIVCFTTEPAGKTTFRNKICVVDFGSGKVREIRKKTEPEDTFIRGIRLSASKLYLVVLLKDQPFQMWEIRTGSLLRSISHTQITALEWSPTTTVIPPSSVHANHVIPTPLTPSPSPTFREQFVFCTPDGGVHFNVVESNQITSQQTQVDIGIGVVSSIAWRDNLLVFGGATGAIQVFNLEKRKMQSFETNKGLVRRLKFSPSSGSHVLVLFNDGEFGIWDVEHNTRVANSNYFTKSRDLKAIDIDWLSETQPILATTDGCIRVVDRQLSGGCNSSIHLASITYPLHSPLVLPPMQALFLKAMLLHPELSSENHSSDLTGLVDQNIVSQLKKSTCLADRALVVAKYFGHSTDIRFWMLALNSLKKKSLSSGSPVGKGKEPEVSADSFKRLAASPKKQVAAAPREPSESAIVIGADDSNEEENLSLSMLTKSGNFVPSESIATPPTATADNTTNIPSFFDLLADSSQVNEMYHNRSRLHEQKKGGNYQLTQKVIDFSLMLGEKDKAVDLLLETPPENTNFYADALKACVVAASVSPTTFQNTVKLVATNLISNDAIEEGVQLLCLIGKSLDACNVLQSYDRWTEAALLAKLALGPEDTALVFRRWANFLISSNQLNDAVEVELTLGDWDAVVFLLHRAGLPDLAALFARAASEFGMFSPTELDRKAPSTQEISMKNLLESIYADYGFYLSRIGYKRAAKYYWESFSGDAGQQFLQSSS
jgi:WD repeat-containing protein 11